MAYMCQWIILLLTRPYELLSEAVAMGNTKAKEQIGYLHLVSVDEQLVMLVTIWLLHSLGLMLHKILQRLVRYLQSLQLKEIQLDRW